MCYKRPVSKENEKGLLAEFGGPFQLCHSLNFLQGLWARKKSMSLLKGSSAFLLQTINDASMPIHFPYKNLSWCKHSFPSWPLFLIFLLFIFICLKVFQVSESLGVDDRMEAVELGSGIKPLSPEGNQPWIFIGRADTKAEAPVLWPTDVKSWLIRRDPDVAKDWKQRGQGDNRGWDGWRVSPTQWTWIWANSRRWWRTGKPGMLQSLGSQRVRHN